MTYEEYLQGDDDILDFFMDIYRSLQENLKSLKNAIDYEEVKGLFPGFKRTSLYKSYQEKLSLLLDFETWLLRFCPSLSSLLGEEE